MGLLPALLILAFALRVVAALQPGFHHPDAVYQYLEPAHRLLDGTGAITWEWRVAMRGWLLPWLMAAPMALGQALAPDSGLSLLLPKLAVAIASLAIVWSAWTIGARTSRLHAAFAGFVAATWFELIHFSTQTLSEPLATAALFPAAALLTAPRPRRAALAGAGLLLGLAVLARPQYAPAAMVLVLVAQARDWRTAFPPVILGGLVALGIGGLADIAAGAPPLAWIGENVHQNLVVGRAAAFGVSPPNAFFGWMAIVWGVWLIPIAIGLVPGRRRAPALFWAAVANLALHSLIGHKEYRFVLLSTAGFVIVAALGWAELATRVRRHRRAAVAGLFAAWGVASLVLGTTGAGGEMRRNGRAGTTLFAQVRGDPGACGVAVGADFADTPGLAALRADQPLSAFLPQDPAVGDHALALMTRWQAGYNRIVAPGVLPVPAGYARLRCESVGGPVPLCLFARAGTCAGSTPFALNAALARADR